jgi:hypothetical protein
MARTLRCLVVVTWGALLSAGCGTYRPAPVLVAPLDAYRDSGFVLAVQDDAQTIEIDTMGRLFSEYEASLAEEHSWARATQVKP